MNVAALGGIYRVVEARIDGQPSLRRRRYW